MKIQWCILHISHGLQHPVYFLLYMSMEMLLEPVVTFPEATERKVYLRFPTC